MPFATGAAIALTQISMALFGMKPNLTLEWFDLIPLMLISASLFLAYRSGKKWLWAILFTLIWSAPSDTLILIFGKGPTHLILGHLFLVPLMIGYAFLLYPLLVRADEALLVHSK